MFDHFLWDIWKGLVIIDITVASERYSFSACGKILPLVQNFFVSFVPRSVRCSSALYVSFTFLQAAKNWCRFSCASICYSFYKISWSERENTFFLFFCDKRYASAMKPLLRFIVDNLTNNLYNLVTESLCQAMNFNIEGWNFDIDIYM